ncbi:MAG: UpxY family transcription antiterminator [Duncaniella sp.]|nr:UpxY family transcription antiterminator [Duncaniella sp.]
MSLTQLRWFALKVFYNKVFDMEARLKEKGIESYIPMTTIMIERDGAKKKLTRPLISSLMFFRSTPEDAIALQPIFEGKAMTYSRRTELRREPVPIPEHEMNVFMLVTSSGETGVEYIGEDSPRYHKGDLVRVTEGPFKGSEGHIIRIKDDHRLVVTIKGLCAVATSYIPRCFLQKIETT